MIWMPARAIEQRYDHRHPPTASPVGNFTSQLRVPCRHRRCSRAHKPNWQHEKATGARQKCQSLKARSHCRPRLQEGLGGVGSSKGDSGIMVEAHEALQFDPYVVFTQMHMRVHVHICMSFFDCVLTWTLWNVTLVSAIMYLFIYLHL